MNKPTFYGSPRSQLLAVTFGKAQAAASILGSESYPDIAGTALFYQTDRGVIVSVEVAGLPVDGRPCREGVFGFHIHTGSDCGGDMADPFADAMTHYNPEGCEHPYHAGDLPPLFGNDGLALAVFLTNRFTVDEVIDRTVIIHDRPDDFTTQPSGNSGTKIACGVIRKLGSPLQNICL